ncbi:MAG: DUF3025 domain-containing protein [Nitrosomonas sp.]|nr:MAG: DUF3025 domain-containing protein [Nitrosomonas sp.]
MSKNPQSIDWHPNFIDTSPLFMPFEHLKYSIRQLPCWPQHNHLNHLIAGNEPHIQTQSGKTVRFVPQVSGKQNLKQDYETRIHLTGEIQTRANNWHDFFNALVWKIFPRTKSLLNQIHYQALQFEVSQHLKNRSKLRDAATLFDESGVIVVSDRPLLLRLLVNFEWKSLFWQQRNAVIQSMRFFIFGHGLYEKALTPYIGMTGKGIVINVEPTFFAQTIPMQLKILDAELAVRLCNEKLSAKLLTPVPLLGYPGWSDANGDAGYYENKHYFRTRQR